MQTQKPWLRELSHKTRNDKENHDNTENIIKFALEVLNISKEHMADGWSSEEDENIMELAAKYKVGNVRREIYDPEKHGEMNCDLEKGDEFWYWGT